MTEKIPTYITPLLEIFDKAGFESLTEEQKIGLYASATAIGVSADTTKVSEIASKLNEMVASIKESGENKKPSGGGGGAGGGGGFNVNLVEDTEKKEDTAQTEEAPTVEPFKDAHLALWANDALLFVRSKGIMVGDGTNVRPVDAITRGEFAKILSLAFELSMASSPAEFSDAGDAWWKEYAQIMISNGVMNGIENGIFGGERKGVLTVRCVQGSKGDEVATRYESEFIKIEYVN